MSSVCGKPDYRTLDSHLDKSSSSPINCFDGSKLLPSSAVSEDAQESDGDDNGYINQSVNKVHKDKEAGNTDSNNSSQNTSDEEEEDVDFAATLKQIFSETAQESLIPATKGSREKHGLGARKLRVSWAADVYDPPPSIVSHTRSNKKNHHHQQKQRCKSKENQKKNGKRGQKGSSNSSSRNGSGKEKKQSSRRHSRDKFPVPHTDAFCVDMFFKANAATNTLHYSLAAQAL